MPKVDYQSYINSDAWQDKRAAFLASGHRQSKKCYLCRQPYQRGWHVHHLTYERLGTEDFNDLTVACPDHHEEIHNLHDCLVARQGKRGPRVSIKNSSKKARRAFKAAKREKKKKAKKGGWLRALLG